MAVGTKQTCVWKGASGTEYTYWVYPISQLESGGFTATPGNYIFVRYVAGEGHYAIYAGQTGDLSERFDDHHKMSCIRRNGATHTHVHASPPDEDIRKTEERDVIAKWNPPCNG